MLGLRCGEGRAFSGCSEQELLSSAVHGIFIAVTSRCGAHALQAWGFSSCGSHSLGIDSVAVVYGLSSGDGGREAWHAAVRGVTKSQT